jgi:ribosomal protein S8
MKSIQQMISILKLSSARRKMNAKVPYSSLNIKILSVLYSHGFIRGYRRVTSTVQKHKDFKNIYIFLKISNHRLSFLDMAYFCPRNKYSALSYKQLVRFYGLKTFGIVTTNVGLLTIEQCFLFKKSGYMLFLIC